MDNPGLPDNLWTQLTGGLWHATNRDGFEGIIAEMEIKVPTGNRYVGAFCRQQDSISLFDLGPHSENVEGQFGNWSGWFGHQQDARVSIWLEIDRARVRESLLDARVAREAWRTAIHETFIPGIEACHRGPIPLGAIVSALLIDQHNWTQFRRLDQLDHNSIQEVEAFEATLPAHEADPIVVALLAGRTRTHD